MRQSRRLQQRPISTRPNSRRFPARQRRDPVYPPYQLRSNRHIHQLHQPPSSITATIKKTNRPNIRLFIQRPLVFQTSPHVLHHVEYPDEQNKHTPFDLNHSSPKHQRLHVQESHPEYKEISWYLDDSPHRLYCGPLGLYAHYIDPIERRYCSSPEPISRERGGDLDPSQSKKAGELEDMEKELEMEMERELEKKLEMESKLEVEKKTKIRFVGAGNRMLANKTEQGLKHSIRIKRKRGGSIEEGECGSQRKVIFYPRILVE